MNADGLPPGAELGRLTFGLSPAELGAESEALLTEARRRLDALAGEPAAPTVDGFLTPLDEVLLRVRDLGSHASLLFSTHPVEEARNAARAASEAADRFFNEFRVRPDVYAKLRGLPLDGVDPATRWAVEKLVREMRRAGAELPEEERRAIVALSNSIDESCNQFMANIAAGQGAIDVSDASELAGVPDDYRAAHPPGPEGRIRLTTSYPDVFPVMAYCENPEVRRRMLEAFLNVAHPANLDVLTRLLQQRRDLARRLGFPDFAAFATEDKMMARPEAVRAFLDRLEGILRAPAAGDLDRLLVRKRRDQPTATRLEPWDASYWSAGYYDTKLRQETFGVDPRELRAYLPFGRIRDGLFALCGSLFGLTFVRRAIAVWHPSVEAYEVSRAGRPIGICYLDLVPRPGKYNHAACFGVREGVRGRLPQAALICNFIDPTVPSETARMEYRDVVTFFHEFGHLLHALLSGRGRWLYNTMSSIELDFIEAPSQLFEEWARDPATLRRFAVNPDTGETVPVALVEKLKASEAMGRAARELRQVALAAASLDFYQVEPDGLDTTAEFRKVWDRTYPAPFDPAYHAQLAWGHLTGYSACYYTYLWSEVIARDLLTPFHAAASLTDPAAARRYAERILMPGGTRPAAELVRDYLDREFTFDAYQRWVLQTPAAPEPIR